MSSDELQMIKHLTILFLGEHADEEDLALGAALAAAAAATGGLGSSLNLKVSVVVLAVNFAL